MTTTPTAPTIQPPAAVPQSTALAEAGLDSLNELLNRDPEHYQDQDLSRIVEALRTDRGRREKAAAEAEAKGGRGKPKALRADQIVAPSGKSAAEMDL